MNNNLNTERALLGTFEKAGYLQVGTAEKPAPYGTDRVLPARWKGKQFGTLGFAHSDKTSLTDIYFEKKHNWVGDGDKYVDKWRYIESGQEKKKGFGTSDYSKRDEFSNTVRTLQWREQLDHEAKWTRRAIEFFNEASEATASMPAAHDTTGVHTTDPVLLYDLIHEKPPGPKAPAGSKVHRDTNNHTMTGRERNFGALMTSSRLAFTPPTEHHPPEFGNKPLLKTTFYRKTGVFWAN